jgi:phosphohistidine phosphatase
MLGRVKTLLLLRHAKSDRGDPSVPDHDRPLAPRGRDAAPRIAGWLEAQRLAPEHVRCSTARRTRETLDLIRPAIPGADVELDEEIYLAPADTLLERVRALPDYAGTALLVGHNPGLQQLALDLLERSPSRRSLEGKFPTGAVAVVSLPVQRWAETDAGAGSLLAYVTPRELA